MRTTPRKRWSSTHSSQRARYQGAVRLRPTIYEVGTWDAVQEASLHYIWHCLTKIRCQSLQRFRNSWVWFGVTAGDSWKAWTFELEVKICPWVFSLLVFSSSAPALQVNYARSVHITTFIEEESIPVWLDFGCQWGFIELLGWIIVLNKRYAFWMCITWIQLIYKIMTSSIKLRLVFLIKHTGKRQFLFDMNLNI